LKRKERQRGQESFLRRDRSPAVLIHPVLTFM
jgi:hypothetical protein